MNERPNPREMYASLQDVLWEIHDSVDKGIRQDVFMDFYGTLVNRENLEILEASIRFKQEMYHRELFSFADLNETRFSDFMAVEPEYLNFQNKYDRQFAFSEMRIQLARKGMDWRDGSQWCMECGSVYYQIIGTNNNRGLGFCLEHHTDVDFDPELDYMTHPNTWKWDRACKHYEAKQMRKVL